MAVTAMLQGQLVGVGVTVGVLVCVAVLVAVGVAVSVGVGVGVSARAGFGRPNHGVYRMGRARVANRQCGAVLGQGPSRRAGAAGAVRPVRVHGRKLRRRRHARARQNRAHLKGHLGQGRALGQEIRLRVLYRNLQLAVAQSEQSCGGNGRRTIRGSARRREQELGSRQWRCQQQAAN